MKPKELPIIATTKISFQIQFFHKIQFHPFVKHPQKTIMVASAFIQAMDCTNHLSAGENGALECTSQGVQESRVALFFALVRDLSSAMLAELMKLALNDARSENDPAIIADIFLMAFQTRHCRGGKGEKDLFYKIIMELVVLYPQTVENLMHLVPHYGSFKDWFQFVAMATDEKTDVSVKRAMLPVVNTIMDLVTEQLIKDQTALDEMENSESQSSSTAHTKGISLLAKWAPREKKRFKKQVQVLANKVFPASKAPKKEYCQLLSRLNKAINSCEVLMSSNQWHEIDFGKVPSVCLLKNRKAFLNEKIKEPLSSPGEEDTGNRYPNKAERVECRKRLRDTMLHNKSQKLKGRQLFPHELVKKFMGRNDKLSTLEKELLSCQWEDIRANVITSMEQVRAKNALDQACIEAETSSVDLGNIVPVVDVSGSMSGTAMEVAIALGILVSEITSPAFANRCMTFSQTPSWVVLDGCSTLQDKVKNMQHAPWGMNTDFEKATELVLQAAIEAQLSPDEIPDLIIFSDMQFDQARNRSGDWETHHKRIVRRFKEEGLSACGKEWPAPHIIYWNLRGVTNGFPAQGNTPNVTMLSGFSPSLMKLLLDGEPLKEVGDGTQKIVKKNPFSMVRAVLDADDYNAVRRVLSASNEGLLKEYKLSEDSTRDLVVLTKGKPGEKEDDWELVN